MPNSRLTKHFGTRTAPLAVAALLFSDHAAVADRVAVEAALRRMELAVLAGDPVAYLEQVAADDPVFRREQEAWAEDLRRHVPKAFDLAIEPHEPESSKPAPVFGESRATFELIMVWTMPGLRTGEPDLERTISFPVVFERVGDAWRYRGEDWLTLREADVGDYPANLVKHFPGFEEAASGVLGVLPEVREHVDAGFQNRIDRTQEVKLYPSMLHLQSSISLSYTDGLGGWNEPGESIKLLVGKTVHATGLRPMLAHEYGHVATFELGPRATEMPWWALEGVAELAAERFAAARAREHAGNGVAEGADAAAAVAAWSKADELAPWDQITDFRNTPARYRRHVYKQGQHLIGWVSGRYGRTARNAWLRAMANGRSLDDATREVFGVGWDELDRRWRASLPAAGTGTREDAAP